MIQAKYCSNSATERSKRHLNASDDGFGEFGRVVYSPDNLTQSQHLTPDWGVLAEQHNPYDPYYLDPNRGFGQVGNFLQRLNNHYNFMNFCKMHIPWHEVLKKFLLIKFRHPPTDAHI